MFADRGPKIYMPPILVALPTKELQKQRESLPDPGAEKGKKKRHGNQNADIGGDYKNMAEMTQLRKRIPRSMGLPEKRQSAVKANSTLMKAGRRPRKITCRLSSSKGHRPHMLQGAPSNGCDVYHNIHISPCMGCCMACEAQWHSTLGNYEQLAATTQARACAHPWRWARTPLPA